jgi:alkylation response protein AidB-like acyl-CoA dehydrogenase
MEGPMNFRFTPEQDALRQEVRAFLRAEVPEDHPEPHIVPEEGTQEEWEFAVEVARKLQQRGWFTAHWPVEHGGLPLGPIDLAVIWEEIAYQGILTPNAIGMLTAQIILQFGTESQKREHLPPIAALERIWAEGYSEPDAGSDLAGLRTTAIRSGDVYIMNGTKTWTGSAHRSNWMFVFSRTDPEAPKHRGISYLLVPLDAPGLNLVPIQSMAGTVTFSQEFFEDVRVPVANLVGEENRGWYMRHEIRGGRGPSGVGPNDPNVAQRHLHQLVRYCREEALAGRSYEGETVRHRLAELAIENDVLRTLSYRLIAGGAGGPDRVVASEIVGIMRREHMQRLARTGVSVLGLAGALVPDGSPWVRMQGWFARQYLYSVPATIYGGAVEIHRDLVARALGLPRA